MEALKLNRDIVPLSEFRASIATSIERLRGSQRPLLLTQRGRGVAVVVDVDAFEVMRERLEVLQDIETARRQFVAGEVYSTDEAKAYVNAGLK